VKGGPWDGSIVNSMQLQMREPGTGMTRLLVVDDEPEICRVLMRIFTQAGVNTTCASDAQSALDFIASESPDVVVLDLQLPNVHGLSLVREIRATKPDVPVVVLTGHGEVRSAVRATRLGVFDYLTKPIDAEEIGAVVERAIERRRLVAEVEALRRQVGDVSVLGPGRREPPAPAIGDRSLREIVEAAARGAEIGAIREALRLAKGNKAQAARLLRVDYKTLHVKIKRYGICAGESEG